MTGFFKERRLEPKTMTGLLAGQDWFSLMVANQSPGVTVVANAGMISGANQRAIETVGCRSSSA